MPRSKSPLWLSGAFLILTYAIFGWLAITWQLPSRWVVLVVVTIIANIVATNFDRSMNTLLKGMFGASMWSLICLMGLVTFLVIILTKLPIFMYSSLILATALLLSIDLHESSLSRFSNFMTLLICQILAFGLGFGGHTLLFRSVYYWQHFHR
jgi:hypothetical protein